MTVAHERSAIVEHVCPRGGFLAEAARRIVQADGAAGLHRSVVLVPDLHCVPDVSRALHAAAGFPVLLLPRITTLRAWAGEVPLGHPVMGDAAREVLLYRTLAERGWLDRADLWAVCAELRVLFDELTREHVCLPDSQSGFAEWLKRAYGCRSGPALDFEARLVHDLWRAFGTAPGGLDCEAAYLLALQCFVQSAQVPLHVVAPGRLSRSEAEFMERYAGKARVSVYRPESDLSDPCEQILAAAWQCEPKQSLVERAEHLRAASSASPLADRVRIAGAANAEHEAQVVDTAVRERLVAGKQRIAVVVQDRITARRARALLERAGVLVSEESGWALSTTSAATIISRWLDAASGDFYHQDLLDVLKSPFVFCDWPRGERQQAVWRLEQKLRTENVIAGIDNFIACASRDAEAWRMLTMLKSAARPLQRRRATPARWLEILMQGLTTLGVRAGYARDAAGEQVWELLEGLREELAGEKLTIGFTEWRQWLARQLDTASFRDRSIESPVVFTYLGALALRSFDAIIVAGGDAAHLPNTGGTSLFFNQRVRAQLGLPVRADQMLEADEALAGLIAGCRDVVITWQRSVAGERNLLSPQLERLNALHRLAYGTSLEDMALPERSPASMVRAAAGPARANTRPAPAASPELVPHALSASGHNTLMACPYQYYARYILRLAEIDVVQELIEKSDYGERVHSTLARFHRQYPSISGLDRQEVEETLTKLTIEAFADAVKTNYLARAWLERWKALIPQYLDWQRKREAEGWHVVTGEADRTLEVRTPAGRTLILRGRIDRVDGDHAGRTALIDYKTQRPDRLRAKAEADGEDVQLPFYALLWAQPVAEALFVGIERDGVAGHKLKAELGTLTAAVRERIVELHDALHEGTPLPAHGAEAVCNYCEASGLCRRAHWDE